MNFCGTSTSTSLLLLLLKAAQMRAVTPMNKNYKFF